MDVLKWYHEIIIVSYSYEHPARTIRSILIVFCVERRYKVKEILCIVLIILMILFTLCILMLSVCKKELWDKVIFNERE